MKMLTTLCLLLSLYCSHAQVGHKFQSGLVAGPVHRYGREAVVVDQVAYLLSNGKLAPPREGETLPDRDGSSEVRWERIDVDSTGRFRGTSLANGYLYLTYNANATANASINIQGNSMFYFNGEPRAGDIYRDGWMHMPVTLRKGLNEILIRCTGFSRWQGVQAELILTENPVQILTGDATLPNIVPGQTESPLWGAVVISNGTMRTLSGTALTATIKERTLTTPVPDIPPMTIRKVPFQFDAGRADAKGTYGCSLKLGRGKRVLAEGNVSIEAVDPTEQHSFTFKSGIDGSVQYYSIAPQANGFREGSALFLSVHGAGVEAIGQARAYASKEWGTLVAPTNRRPRGFNWEDWGRLDALEVLNIAMEKFSPDPSKIYLTGHSMGGHGTWYLGATYPDKWAAIAPCAGYPTLSGYGSADGQIPREGRNVVENLLLRASNGSDVVALASNYKAFGIYVHHGDSDRVVPVTYAREMRNVLSKFHGDFSYYEYPGGSHWFGSESVDWPPLFDFFRWHVNKHDTSANVIDFSTANPAVSSRYRWASIEQQIRPLQYSRIELNRNIKTKLITGTTDNVAILKLDISDFRQADTLHLTIDGESLDYNGVDTVLYLYRRERWQISGTPDAAHKNPVRGGGFKESFNHNFVFVYSTKGTRDENNWSYNKARYDAEVWYYRGNGSVDVVADRDFSASKYKDRGVVIYGNATTNAAWEKLLASCPIQLKRGHATLGPHSFQGMDIGAYFMWPRADSNVASVAVVGGTGLPGMHATEANQYFAGGSGFPDFLIFSAEMLKDGVDGMKAAGFYGNDWSLEGGDVEIQN